MPREGFPSIDSALRVADLVTEACTAVACTSPDCHKDEVHHLMQHALHRIELEDFSGTTVNRRGYARKLIYTHPAGFFSVLQLKWMPGAKTPIHGHNAWGCVGVISGEIGCDTFEEASSAKQGVRQTGSIRASRGDIATVNPNPEGIHCLYNPTDRVATTLHIYGMDLGPNPCAINVPYEKGSHA